MTEAIIVALISGAISLIGILLSHKAATDKLSHELDKQQAVIGTRIDLMKEDIREHNHYAKLFAESMPVVKEQIKVINHRIDDLERAEENKRAREQSAPRR